jgi:adenine-specific DNA-methyltransferase
LCSRDKQCIILPTNYREVAILTELIWPSIIERKAYRDTWGRGLDSYLQWFYETVILLRELLTENGTIYVHCDSGINSHIRLVMDEVFGSASFINELIWRRTGTHGTTRSYGVIHETILFYSKSDAYTFHPPSTALEKEYIERILLINCSLKV